MTLPHDSGSTRESAPTASDIRHSVVYELADAGFSTVEIAKDLGRTTGEIELILKLRAKTEPADAPDNQVRH